MGIFEDVARLLGGELVGHGPLAGGVSSRVTLLDLAMPVPRPLLVEDQRSQSRR